MTTTEPEEQQAHEEAEAEVRDALSRVARLAEGEEPDLDELRARAAARIGACREELLACTEPLLPWSPPAVALLVEGAGQQLAVMVQNLGGPPAPSEDGEEAS